MTSEKNNVKSGIRKMTACDKAEVLDMMNIFYKSDAVFTNGSSEIFLNDFENCIGASPYLDGYIFFNETEIQGYAMIAKSFSTEFGKPCIWIEDIYIKPMFRGRGIAERFLKYLHEAFPDTIQCLEAEKENSHALHVYDKCGFSVSPYIVMKRGSI